MSGFNNFKEEIRHRLPIQNVVNGYGTILKKSGHNKMKGLCPLHGERTPSFTIDTERGTFHCFGCHQHGDVFDFIEAMEPSAVDFKSTLKIAATHAGLNETTFTVDPALAARREKARTIAEAKRDALDAKKAIRNNNKIADIMALCVPAKGTIVEDYLRSRYISQFNGALSILKYCPMVDYYNSDTGEHMGKHGAMVGYICNAERKVIGLHITYLAGDGTKLRLFDDDNKSLPCKKMIGKFMGGILPLCKASGDTLALAEGIETALSATILRDRPTWSVCSSANFATLSIPKNIKVIYLMLDQGSKDEIGYRNSWSKAVSKLSCRGFEVRGGWPAHGDDFNYMLEKEIKKKKEATL